MFLKEDDSKTETLVLKMPWEAQIEGQAMRWKNSKRRPNSVLLIVFLLPSAVIGWSYLSSPRTFFNAPGYLGDFLRRTSSGNNNRNICVCYVTEDDKQDRSSSSSFFPKTSPATSKVDKGQKQFAWVGADQLNQIKSEVDMVSFIESYDLPQFRRTGSNRAVALCPFHDDNNPSMNVDGQRGLYKCFACGAGGDAFHFARSYHKQHVGGEMSFLEAIKHVRDFSLGISPGGDTTAQTADTLIQQVTVSRMTNAEREVLANKQKRILAMNQEAAKFFLTCLGKQFAGSARQYLISRGLGSATTVRHFAIGFAPDVYFNNRYLPTEQKSLVSHLRDCGYNASEILESGLAIQMQKRENRKSQQDTFAKAPLNEAVLQSPKEDDIDFSSLMDRFRGRLMVPILDRTGENVVAFGGRILPSHEEAARRANFSPPKYLNSPETEVFQKKAVLFGQHTVIMETETQHKKKAPELDSVLIVEGYMDVISLWNIGIKSAIATMGTAVSTEQIGAAAKLAKPRGGRVIICLDNDRAGKEAMERLCSGNFFADAAVTYGVQFLVAMLPGDIKDPGEFIEQTQRKGRAAAGIADSFRKDVMNTAVDWREWFLNWILEGYNSTSGKESSGSFGAVFQRMADFLATFPNPADRTRSAYEIAGKLAEIMASDNNSSHISSAARVQLESDLIDSASRIAKAKESMKRRVEDANGGIRSLSKLTVAAMSRGVASTDINDVTSKLSRKARTNLTVTSNSEMAFALNVNQVSYTRPNPSVRKTSSACGQNDVKRPRRRMYRPLKEKQATPSFTPHFSGFDFRSQNDADWLGVPRNKGKHDLGVLTLDSKPFYECDSSNSGGKKKPVYFNSNEYHGGRFITSDAVTAGYSDKNVPAVDSSSLINHGISSLLAKDANATQMAAEDALFRALVHHYPNARNAIRDILTASASAGTDVDIQWSSPERKWLFDSLVHDKEIDQIDESIVDPEELRAYLQNRSDAPLGSFKQDEFASALNTGNEAGADRCFLGSLDIYFISETSLAAKLCEVNDGHSILNFQREKAILSAQECLMNLLLASSENNISRIKRGLKIVAHVLDERISSLQHESSSPRNGHTVVNSSDTSVDMVQAGRDVDGAVSQAGPHLLLVSEETPLSVVKEQSVMIPDPYLSRFKNVSTDEVRAYYASLVAELRKLTARRTRLQESSRWISKRLLRNSRNLSLERQEAQHSQKKLAKMLDEHMAELERNKTLGIYLDYGDDRYRPDEHSSVEEELAGIKASWGEWCNDDYIWSPEKAIEENKNKRYHIPLPEEGDTGGFEYRKSVEEELAEFEESWGEWCNDDFVWTPEKAETKFKPLPLVGLDDQQEEEEDDGETIEEALERIRRDWGDWGSN